MEVKNLSWNSTTARSNHKLLPKNVRGLIIGKSGCGKTTLLLNLLLNPGWLDYNKLLFLVRVYFNLNIKYGGKLWSINSRKKLSSGYSTIKEIFNQSRD